MTASPPNSQRPPSAGGSERPPFRLGGLLAPLIEAGYDEDAREVVELYLEDHLTKTAEIAKALEMEDLETCGQAAHILIGSAGGIGASKLAVALASFEEACRKQDLSRVRQEFPVVLSEEDRVLVTVRRFLAGEVE